MNDVVLPVANAIQPTSSKSPFYQTLPAGYIHLGVSKEIVPTLREFGLDPDPLIRKVGLDPRLFDDGRSQIPSATLGQLYALCVAQTHCPHFGLLVGQRASILSLEFVGRLYLHPVVLGHGKPFFAGPRPPLLLIASDLMDKGVVRLTYVPA